jgi:hypothetical protein
VNLGLQRLTFNEDYGRTRAWKSLIYPSRPLLDSALKSRRQA